jgi:uncharacterized protein (TIGR02145 family)
LAVLPVIATTVPSGITASAIASGGNITSDGGAAVTARGICWGIAQNPTIDNSKNLVGTGTGSFASTITGLNPGTTYYIRAFATNSIGTVYGNEVTAKTLSTIPVLSTTAISAITSTTATSGGNITSDGGAAVTVRGICWSTSQNPTIADPKTSTGTGSGSFTSNLTGLTAGATYYVRAYSTNSVGTAYGNELTLTTIATLPTLTTTAVSAITSTTATSGGTITNDGGSLVTARGVCWSTSQNPTIADSKTSNETGTGSFVSAITGLTPGMTYYIRAYATNGIGTVYGNELTFTTTATLPTITTTAISAITSTTATSGGNITNDGGSAIKARGVCWSTIQNPTIVDSKTLNGTGSGNFTSSLTGLTTGATYYVRAYATNSVGTAYGNQQSFTTISVGGPCKVSIKEGTAISICAGPSTQLTAMPSGLAGSTITYSWSPETGLSDPKIANPIANPAVTTTYTVSATDGTCSPTSQVRITVNPLPIIDFTFPSGNQSAGTAVQFTSSVVGTGSFSYSWNFGDGTSTSTIANPSHVFATNAGNGSQPFNVTLTVTNTTTNCVSSIIKSITINQSPELTVTDIDGNVYHTVTIGTQVWMVENLKTTKYRNGDPIPNVTVNSIWERLTSGAYCWYNNDASTYKATYGALYNWYCAADSRNIAPTGWHVPTDAEWTTLTTFLGGESVASGELKEAGFSHWINPNIGATNGSGFTALPGGSRGYIGSFYDIGGSGWWWTSTAYSSTGGWQRYLQPNTVKVYRYGSINSYGYSVRCLRD